MRGDAVRVSVSSQPSTSSQGSGQDDYDALGYVFMWGEGVGNGLLGGGSSKFGSTLSVKRDAFFPKAVGSSIVLDAKQIACGSKHAVLVTRQGEAFSWGEESGGWLGHGVRIDVPYPKLIDALVCCTIEFVACGEYHTCAVTQTGDLYTWGDGAHKFGLLGHGEDISHWVPKRVGGSLERLRVTSVACGPWHTALVTSSGQLFTFGDGTFGVLGHGDRRSVSVPREVDSLKGLRTVKAACGVWHTAAVVEVMVGYSSSSTFSGKLFTWGNGDKGRLGHGDNEQKLVPTCVSVLIDYNFLQVACGNSLTVALTTSGHVFTVGSMVYGQLGDPRAEGKIPVRVDGRLWDAVVEEIACGAYHVAVLTSKSEVYTWGKGANGRLGHGDADDKNVPTLVEALKDRQVRSIACGSSFTAAICFHKWGAGSEQPSCASCRQPFSFTRKRHKCYNCGIVVCHACSSKKTIRALMAPNPNKPYRVCDPCFVKLTEMNGHVNMVSKAMKKQHQDERYERSDIKSALHPPAASFQMDARGQPKPHRRPESLSSRVSVTAGGELMWKESSNNFTSNKAYDLALHASVMQSRRGSPRRGSRSLSPFSRRASPPRATTLIGISGGVASSKSVVDELKKTNEALSQEVLGLRKQIESLMHSTQLRETELQKKVNDAVSLAAEESEKCKAAKEVIKALTSQLKSLAERLPDATRVHLVDTSQPYDTNRQPLNGLHTYLPDENSRSSSLHQDDCDAASNDTSEYNGVKDVLKNTSPRSASNQNSVSEWVEQDDCGVYVTLVALSDGRRDLKRVRFSRKHFTESQAELWWSENRGRIFRKYNVKGMNKTTMFEARAARQ